MGVHILLNKLSFLSIDLNRPNILMYTTILVFKFKPGFVLFDLHQLPGELN